LNQNNAIFVTKPSLPPIEEYIDSLKKIWHNNRITNNGEFTVKFEQALADYLNVKYVRLVTNGTLGLLITLQALRIQGEVITTPFSFVATTHSIYWNGLSPVFCDIESDCFNLNPHKIESLITPKTTAILPVHVFGKPVDVEAIQSIADNYGLKVIYDASHAFGVDYKGESILNFGNASIISFHATKVFNSVEGGAIITNDKKLADRVSFSRNFGFADEVTVVAPGINAKMNEFISAFGLIQLKHFKSCLNERKIRWDHYHKHLYDVKGISTNKEVKEATFNYSYYPIIVDPETYSMSRDELYNLLKDNNIFSRRYFYPLISQFPTYKNMASALPGKLPNAERITEQVLCLPLYDDLALKDIDRIISIIQKHS